ncbi:MAG TPA: hypothetical protein VKH45_07500 [Candidatus Acidoferrum sp.]|nr:hypothetical protein [Candidatus Acidoferrum sp.]
MAVRDKILDVAEYWVSPGEYRPTEDDLISFFTESGAEAAPTLEEAREALTRLSNGVRVQGQIKHLCGIFACYVLRQAGVDVRWTLLGGNMVGDGVTKLLGYQNIVPGDVAIINRASHHFIVSDIDYASNTLLSVDGNTANQYIRLVSKKIHYDGSDANTKSVVAFYRVKT